MSARAVVDAAPRRAMWPLHPAGFTIALGAHGIAANLGGFSEDAVTSSLVPGGLLALYDGAEVLLKPVFRSLADRIGTRPVVIGGLIAFAAASASYAMQAADRTRLSRRCLGRRRGRYRSHAPRGCVPPSPHAVTIPLRPAFYSLTLLMMTSTLMWGTSRTDEPGRRNRHARDTGDAAAQTPSSAPETQ